MDYQEDDVRGAPLSISLGVQRVEWVVKILNARKIVVPNHASLESTLQTLVALFTHDVKIVVDYHVLYHLGQVVAAACCGLEFVGLVQLAQNAVLEFGGFLGEIFKYFYENILVRKFAFGFVDVHVGDGLLDRTWRLGVLRCCFCDLVDVLVITDEVSVFEEDERMRSVGVEAFVAVGVTALIAGKDYFARVMPFTFAIGF